MKKLGNLISVDDEHNLHISACNIVCSHLYEALGEDALKLIDTRIIEFIRALLVVTYPNCYMLINNYNDVDPTDVLDPNKLPVCEDRGMRCNLCYTSLERSNNDINNTDYHTLGNGIDFDIYKVSADQTDADKTALGVLLDRVDPEEVQAQLAGYEELNKFLKADYSVTSWSTMKCNNIIPDEETGVITDEGILINTYSFRKEPDVVSISGNGWNWTPITYNRDAALAGSYSLGSAGGEYTGTNAPVDAEMIAQITKISNDNSYTPVDKGYYDSVMSGRVVNYAKLNAKHYYNLSNSYKGNPPLNQLTINDVIGVEKWKDLGGSVTAVKTVILALSKEMGVHPSWMVAMIFSESGGDPHSGRDKYVPHKRTATGLFQALDSTVHGLGFPNSLALSAKTLLGQLPYLRAYYLGLCRSSIPHIKGPGDLYGLLYLSGRACKGYNYPMAKRGTPEYDQNWGLDINKDGVITAADLHVRLANKYYECTKHKLVV